jgi:hypothetical protein
VAGLEDVWIPLVDEPIGAIVAQIEDDDPELRALVDSPRRLLAFRTFAYMRVGLVLGQLLVDNDVDPYDGSETWVEQLMHDPAHSERVHAEVRKVAEEIAADPRYQDDGHGVGPDDDARARFRDFARKQLGSS